jgi:hypothetical protein
MYLMQMRGSFASLKMTSEGLRMISSEGFFINPPEKGEGARTARLDRAPVVRRMADGGL